MFIKLRIKYWHLLNIYSIGKYTLVIAYLFINKHWYLLNVSLIEK